ncbi:MAG: spore cortex biosynthesis protein YabQ [Clostridia bacterium]|nr:spore cortex biosynthesis protein YabQ [Clostridia bacterium]
MTFFETAAQGRVFLLLLYAGAGAAVLYDLLTPLRTRCPRPVGIAVDILWCLLAGAVCLSALALGGENHLRLYAMLGMVCGGGIYCLGVRRLILAALRIAGRMFEKRE